MSVKKLLDQKAKILKAEKDKSRQEAQREHDRKRQEFAEAVVKVQSDLEGLDFEKIGAGDFRVNYRDFHRNIPVYVRVEWACEEVRHCDECRGEMEWFLRVGVSSRALNVPDLYCSVEDFAETFSDYLLRIS